jgi:hypothetical protein
MGKLAVEELVVGEGPDGRHLVEAVSHCYLI